MAYVYVVEDDADLAGVLRESLSLKGHTPIVAENGLDALQYMRRLPPDLVILDINMPVLDGFGLARRMRADPLLAQLPILFLTIRSDFPSKRSGYNLGADDYITKPFDLPELHARVQAILCRCRIQESAEHDIVRAGPFVLHLDSGVVECERGCIQLTDSESNLLRYLMCYPSTPVSALQLLEEALDYPSGTGDASTVRFHIRNLRRKLEKDPVHPVYLCTASPRGYCLKV